MYQTFQIDEEEEHNQKPRNNQFEFANKYSNFLQPNFITGQEDQYHQHLESNPASSHKIVSQDVSFASNNQPQPKQGSISNFQKQQEQFYEQKVHQKEELKKISKINSRVIKKEQLHEPNEAQLKNDIAKPSTKHNILFLYEDEEELVQQVKPPQDIHIPHRQINQIFGLDSEIISEDEVTTVTKTSQYFDIQDKEVISRQLLACIERLHLLKIEIARQNSGTNLFWPEYQMRFHKEPGICFAKRTTARPIATYLFSSSANQFDETLTSYIGKIKTNIIGNILYIYGPGLNPKNAGSKGVPPRQMLATIVYQTSFMNQTKPRSFTVYVKHPDKSYFSFKGMKVGDEIGLDELFISSGENRDHISMYQNSKPVWSSKVGGFMLNFKGRVKQPSVKNFILQDMNANEVMMFGKRAQNLFNIEVKDRFSPLVTFGIALSSFDSKFLCQ